LALAEKTGDRIISREFGIEQSLGVSANGHQMADSKRKTKKFG